MNFSGKLLWPADPDQTSHQEQAFQSTDKSSFFMKFAQIRLQNAQNERNNKLGSFPLLRSIVRYSQPVLFNEPKNTPRTFCHSVRGCRAVLKHFIHKFRSIGATRASLDSFPFRCSTMARANSNAVPGPREVINYTNK